MNKIGIVVEYNPFHNGHLYQIEKVREMYGDDSFVAVVMSGNYVQRGEHSILDKWERTEIALNYGVDLIVELPVYYSIQNGEIFAKMATTILEYLDLDFQVFGAEEENLQIFYNIIDIQKSLEYRENLMEKLKLGENYTVAHGKLIEKYGYSNFFKSNNILALEYVRAILEKDFKIKPCPIKRKVSEYNEEEIPRDRVDIASATYVRNKIMSISTGDNIKEFKDLLEFLPEKTYNTLKGKKFFDFKEKIFKILKYKILTENPLKLINIYDINFEIYKRISNEIKNSKTYKELLNNIKAKNFSTKRMDRILMNLLLNIEKLDNNLDYVRVLGFNERGQSYLKELKKNGKNKIFVNWKDIEREVDSYKVVIEKNAFYIDELIFNKSERLNPLIKNKGG